jgi:hypothetical protein
MLPTAVPGTGCRFLPRELVATPSGAPLELRFETAHESPAGAVGGLQLSRHTVRGVRVTSGRAARRPGPALAAIGLGALR